jgi:hypothetical protein
MAIWQSYIAKYLLSIWRFFITRQLIAKCKLAIWQHLIAKCMLAIWQQPIAKHLLAILATSYRLNRNDRVSSLNKTRGSKLCFRTCFSYFSRCFHILVFLQKSLLTNFFLPFLAARESNFSSRFSYLWHSDLVCRTCTPMFLAQNAWVS